MWKTFAGTTALLTAGACAPFWDAREDDASRAWFSPLGPAVEDAARDPDPGERIYAANCAYCHGDSGQGDGEFAPDLPVTPSDLTRLTAANGGTFPARRLLETIHGEPGEFHRSSMPAFERELSGPVVEWRAPDGDVIMTPRGFLDILAYVEGLQDGSESDEG